MKILLSICLVLFVQSDCHHHHRGVSQRHHRVHPLSDEFIHLINSKQTSWKAGRNFHRDTPMSYLRRLMGSVHLKATNNHLLDEPPRYKNVSLKETFDARKKWPYCKSLQDINDQGSCGCCWAVAAASAMSDRICTTTGGKEMFPFSIMDILSCCPFCGSACSGGSLTNGWLFMKKEGVVSGGKYGSKEGCRAFNLAPCEHDTLNFKDDRCGEHIQPPKCIKQCITNSSLDYYADKKKITYVYNVKDPKTEIFENGPITASFNVYEDFMHYKEGVYRHVYGKYLGQHSVKILGYGVENYEEYWLAANSFNTSWGNKGFFKILRGENHCGIEEEMITGLRELPRN